MKFSGVFNLDDRETKRKVIVQIGASFGNHEIEMKPWKPRRSQRANSFWWVGPVKAFQDAMSKQGEEWSKWRAHEFLVKHCLGFDEVVNPKTGEVVDTIRKETHTLTSADFSAMTERAIVFLADYGVEVPTLGER